MKTYNILTSFLCLLLIYACNDTTFDEYNKTKVEEDIPASVVLDFSALENQIQTRAVSDEATEKAVNNLYVFIFNSNGTKATGKYFDKTMLTGTTLSIDTYSGPGKQIFAVANFELNGMMSLTKADLDNIKTKEKLMNMNAQLLQLITSRGSSFLMTGCIESNGQPKNIDIIPGNNPNSLGKIKLLRVDAKVQFNIQAINGAEFTLKEWKVEQLPLHVALFNQTESHFDGGDNFSTEWKKPEGEGANLGKTFAFYVLEHLRAPKTIIESTDPDPWTAYALREKNPFNWLRKENTLPAGVTANDKFVFAHDRATYVVLKGHIKYMKGTVPVEGDVTYTIHLGYFDPVEGNKANDYNVKRNSFYTYNIKIASAERVLVEVETGVEQHPGAEGNLTVGGTNLRFDAHYETSMVEFNKDKIDGNLTWYVKTPFDKGLASSDIKDYKWILFRLNAKTNDEYQTDFVPFTGLQNLYTGTLDAASYLKSSNTLINVDQLVAILISAKKTNSTLFDSKGNVRFTAFVQEYYYDKTPGSNDAFEPTLWKKFVNAPERVMNILSDSKYSPDGNSMRTQVFYSIRQASIQTMYNKDVLVSDLRTAWGTEMIQDDNFYPFVTNGVLPQYDGGAKSGRNGYENTLSIWKVNSSNEPIWSDYINEKTQDLKIKEARYGCMLRNRDLDGNNKISQNEVRWYLAAIDQLTDLWIGEKSFDIQASLYKFDWAKPTTSPNEMFYASSTIIKTDLWGTKENPYLLKSSEGSSVVLYSDIKEGERKGLYYRCVRNLGIKAGVKDIPQDFAKYEGGMLNLSYLDKSSIRDYYTNSELPEHHERQAENMPYRSFSVANNPVSNKFFLGVATMSWTDVKQDVAAHKSPCLKYNNGEPGWRVPNQRELALMVSRVEGKAGWDYKAHMSRTAFSMASNKPGFGAIRYYILDRDNIVQLVGTGILEVGGVRCVRDKK